MTMKFKRISALVLAILTLVSSLPLVSFAQTRSIVYTDAQITVESVAAMPGTSVEVDVKIENNPGILAAKLSFSYDEGLTLTNAVNGDAFSAHIFTKPGKYTSPCNFGWDAEKVADEDIKDGLILTLTFDISEDVIPGETLGIRASYSSGDIINNDIDPISVGISNGFVSVLDYIPGDVNRDGRVNGVDVICLRRYIVGGYDISINELAADVNGDGNINYTDVVIFRRYLAGGYGIELKPGKIKCEHASLEYTAAVAATCTEDGNIEYWYCEECGKYFSDAVCENEITLNDTVVDKSNHDLTHTPYKAPTINNYGNIDYWTCRVCDRVYSDQNGENQITQDKTVIDKLEPSTYSVSYFNYYDCEIPQEYWKYLEGEGLVLPTISRAGYEFLGWFDRNTGRQEVSIPQNATGNYEFEAKWGEAEEYDIFYYNKGKPLAEYEQKSTYDVTDTILIPKPSWTGREFAGWTEKNNKIVTDVDDAGNMVYKIPKGTTGDIELTAHWKSIRNKVVPAKDRKLIVGNKSVQDNGIYHFVYLLGTIENVVVDDFSYGANVQGKSEDYSDSSITITKTLSNSVSSGVDKTIAESISNSISKSQSWNDTVSTAENESRMDNWNATVGISSEISAKAGVDIEGIATAELGRTLTKSLEISTGGEISVGSEYKSEQAIGGESEEGNESTSQSGTTFTYLEQFTTGTEISRSVDGDMPAGYYSFVKLGSVSVYALVSYNIDNGNYYVETYSVMNSNLSDNILYFADYNEWNNPTMDVLEYDIPIDEIVSYIESSYYVQYDANSGEGEMPITVHKVGEKSNVAENKFTKTGYDFDGWEYATSAGSGLVQNKGQIIDIGGKGETITLKAKWRAKSYTVVYNTNKPNEASSSVEGVMADSTYTYDVQSGLPANSFSLTGWTFKGWSTSASGSVEYADKASIKNLTSSDSIILYAVWEPNTYTVVFNANGGSGTIDSMPCTYDKTCKLPTNVFYRNGYTSYGWSTNPSAVNADYKNGTEIRNLASNNDAAVTLYACWTKTSNTVGNLYAISVTGGKESICYSEKKAFNLGLDIAKLKEAGYKNLKISISGYCKSYDSNMNERGRYFSLGNAENNNELISWTFKVKDFGGVEEKTISLGSLPESGNCYLQLISDYSSNYDERLTIESLVINITATN